MPKLGAVSPDSPSHFGPLCERCLLRSVLCVCSESPALDLATRVTLLMHHREAKTTSNTARLAAVALRRCEIRIRGERLSPLRTDDLILEGERSLLLFPSEDAIELTPERVAEWREPLHLIVPDGSWRQARKIAARVEKLGQVTRVKLGPGEPSTYRLRHNPNPGRISTFEAVARALGVLEGPEHRAVLELFFDKRVERALWSRRVLRLSECRTEIPAAAIEAFDLDGRRSGRKALGTD